MNKRLEEYRKKEQAHESAIRRASCTLLRALETEGLDISDMDRVVSHARYIIKSTPFKGISAAVYQRWEEDNAHRLT